MDKKIIGLCGLKGSGKDTVASILEDYGYVKYSYAYPLKWMVSHMFNWSIDLLEGSTTESREWREKTDQWWSDNLDFNDFTPRKALQFLGTNVIRKHFSDDIWILNLKKRIIDNNDKKVVITDCRFPNEIDLVKKLDGEMVHVLERKSPEWKNYAYEYNNILKRNNNNETERSNYLKDLLLNYYEVHESEWAWIGYTDFDHIIYNNGDLNDLYKEIEEKIS